MDPCHVTSNGTSDCSPGDFEALVHSRNRSQAVGLLHSMEAMHLRPCGAPTGVENASCSGASRASAVPARCSYAASPRHRGPATIALSRRMRGGARGGGGLHVAAAAGGERRAGAIFVPRDSASADASASASDKRPASASKDVDALNGALQLSLAAITAPVAEDMKVMNQNLLSIVGSRSPLLMSAAEQIFGAGGKKLRPVLCFLVARATAAAQNLRCVRERKGFWLKLTAPQRAHAAASQAGRDYRDDSHRQPRPRRRA